MLANQRQEAIARQLESAGAVNVADLVARFGVSAETVRKDLLQMEGRGLLRRVHGGAVKPGAMKHFGSLPDRNVENSEKKRQLAQAALDLVEEGDILAIDAGSTAIFFAKALAARFFRLTVVTHCKDVFDILCHHADFRVILCGGEYLPAEHAFYGDLALRTLEALHVQKAFIFPSAVSLTHGVFDFQRELYPLQRRMALCGDRVYILADSTKFEKTGLLKVCDLRPEYTLITDGGLSPEIRSLYAGRGVTLICGREPV